MTTSDSPDSHAPDEVGVYQWRYWQARHAGLDPFQAKAFADSDGDVAELRRCFEKGATPEQILAVVL